MTTVSRVLHLPKESTVSLLQRVLRTEMGDHLAAKDMGRKVEGERWVPSRFNTMSPQPRHTSVPSGILIILTVWPQQTNRTLRQDSQTTVL